MDAVFCGGVERYWQECHSIIDVLKALPRGYRFDRQNSFQVDLDKVDATVRSLDGRCFVFYEGSGDDKTASIVPLVRGSEKTSDVVVNLFIRIRAQGLYLVLPTEEGLEEGFERVFWLRESLDVKDRNEIPLDPVRKAIELLEKHIFKPGVQRQKTNGESAVYLGEREFPVVYSRGREIIAPFSESKPEDPTTIIPVSATLDLSSVLVSPEKASPVEVLVARLFRVSTEVFKVEESAPSSDLVRRLISRIEKLMIEECRDGDQKALDVTLNHACNAFSTVPWWNLSRYLFQSAQEWLRGPVKITSQKRSTLFIGEEEEDRHNHVD